MKLRINLSLRRALMASMVVVSSLMTFTAWGGVADAGYDLQYYMDFARNKGIFTAGATNISVYFKDGTSVSNPVIPLMPNLDSYAQRGQIIMNALSPLGGANLVSHSLYQVRITAKRITFTFFLKTKIHQFVTHRQGLQGKGVQTGVCNASIKL